MASVFVTLCLAATIQVGPTRAITQLSAVNRVSVNPGDVIEVDGDATYAAVSWTRSGTQAAPIRIVGLPVNGTRPRIMGGTNTLEVQGDDVIVDGFELTGGSFRCFFHHANRVTLRNSVVHDCPRHGVLGADQGSGSLLMEFVEVHHCGGGTQDHQIYMATDEVRHQGAVFRMQHCYVHDANGGNSVKTRAERNEVYFNWIEGGLYHELELIGPDPDGADDAWTEALQREDSDVVGNVLVKTNTFSVVRAGGDGTGQSQGRYRFVNNTIVVKPGASAVFRLFDGLESVEMHNNVFAVDGSGGVNMVREVEADWVGTRLVSGSNNWVTMGSTNVPPEWTGTIVGASPQVISLTTSPRPVAGSPLIDAAATVLMSPARAPFPSPLSAVGFEPPPRTLVSMAAVRTSVGAPDVGAFEFGVATGGGSETGGGSATGGSDGATGGGGEPAPAGCSCAAAPTFELFAFAVMLMRRRRGRERDS